MLDRDRAAAEAGRSEGGGAKALTHCAQVDGDVIRLGKGMCSQSRFVTSNADDEELRAAPAAVEFTVVVLAHETVLGATDGNALRIGRIHSPIGEAGNASVTDPDAPSGKLRSALALLEGASDRLLNMSETFAHGLSVAERLVCCNT